MSVKFNILLRACDKVESVHKVKRPYNLNKLQTIKLSFYSLYKSLQNSQYQIKIIGDDLSLELLDFFKNFNDVIIDNDKLGSAAKSLQKQIDIALNVPDDEWVYMCEDDYLHSPDTFKYISELIENKDQYLQTSPKKKNYMNRIIGDLSKIPLIIHPPDYPDRYEPQWKRLSFIFLSKRSACTNALLPILDTTALIFGLTSSLRAIALATDSRTEISLSLIFFVISVAVSCQSSITLIPF